MAEKSLAELRAEAVASMSAPPQDTPPNPDEQPRDEHGRFVAKTPSEPPVEEVEETVYVRDIEIEPGAGVEHFEASSIEELLDKIADAKGHASRKIREQEAELRRLRTQPVEKAPEVRPLSDDEKYVYSQKIMSDPGAAISELADRYILPKLEPRLKKAERAELAIAQGEATQAFMQKHPEFYPSQTNGNRMLKQLALDGYDGTSVEHLEEAFNSLRESGLLESKPAEAPGAGKPQERAVEERIVPQQRESRVVTVRKVVGGLSAKRSAPVDSVPPEPTEEQIRNLPMDQLRLKAVQSLTSPSRS